MGDRPCCGREYGPTVNFTGTRGLGLPLPHERDMGVAEVLCPKDVKTCTRSRAETTLQCGFTRYSCGAY